MTIDASTSVLILTGTATFLTAVGALITAVKTNRKVTQTAEAKRKEAADAAQVIVDAAADQLRIIREEADRARTLLREEQESSGKWKDRCEMLDEKYTALAGRLDTLEYEKVILKKRVIELEAQIKELMEENKRLKEERRNSEAVVA